MHGNGYGIFTIRTGVGNKTTTIRGHRFVYEQMVGLVPRGAEIDHTCHGLDSTCVEGKACPHRACCNPRHLQAVTHKVNMERSRNASPRGHQSRKTHCPKGHPYTPENTKTGMHGDRKCRTCHNDWERQRKKAARRAKVASDSASAA